MYFVISHSPLTAQAITQIGCGGHAQKSRQRVARGIEDRRTLGIVQDRLGSRIIIERGIVNSREGAPQPSYQRLKAGLRQIGGRERVACTQALIDGALEVGGKLHSGKLLLPRKIGVKRKSPEGPTLSQKMGKDGPPAW